MGRSSGLPSLNMLLQRLQRFESCFVSVLPQSMQSGIGLRFAIGFFGNKARFAICMRWLQLLQRVATDEDNSLPQSQHFLTCFAIDFKWHVKQRCARSFTAIPQSLQAYCLRALLISLARTLAAW
jgi:hypothetical protein